MLLKSVIDQLYNTTTTAQSISPSSMDVLINRIRSMSISTVKPSNNHQKRERTQTPLPFIKPVIATNPDHVLIAVIISWKIRFFRNIIKH